MRLIPKKIVVSMRDEKGEGIDIDIEGCEEFVYEELLNIGELLIYAYVSDVHEDGHVYYLGENKSEVN